MNKSGLGSIDNRIRAPRKKPIGQARCGNTRCEVEVEREAICCDTCEKWFHNRCSRIDSRDIALYVANKRLKWVCFQCTTQIKKLALAGQTEEGSCRVDKATDCMDLGGEEKKFEKEKITKQKIEGSKGMSEGVPTTQVPLPRRGQKAGVEGINRRKDAVAQVKDGGEEGETLATIKDMVKAQGEAIKVLEKEKIALSQSVHHLRTASDLALGRNRNVVVKGVPEPLMKENRQRQRALRYHVNNLLRMVGLLEAARIKRVFRLGKWRPEAAPRPVCVEFANPRTRDKFLAKGGEIGKQTQGRFRIEPDDSAGWRSNSLIPPRLETRSEMRVRSTKLPRLETRSELRIRATKLPRQPMPPTAVEATQTVLGKKDHNQGSLDGWVLVGPRRPAAKNGQSPRA